MMLMDFSQIVLSSIMAQIGNHKNIEMDENMIRHVALNSIRYNNAKFKHQYGELIICTDNKNYWRRDIFPYYKAMRKERQKDSELDWNLLFNGISNVRKDLIEYFPYRVIDVDKAEADDIIGTLVHEYGTVLNTPKSEPILIISRDKDFIQLHKYANVKQWDSVNKAWVKHSDPDAYLFEHTIKGDSGDGVPSILCDDDHFVMKKPIRRVTQKRLNKWKSGDFTEEEKRNFARNENLVNLTKIPKNISEEILRQYNTENTKDRSKLYNYFIKYRLRNLVEHISEF